MNTDKFIKEIAKRTNVSQYRIRVTFEVMAQILEEKLRDDQETVKVPGIGRFELVNVKDRKRFSASEGRHIMVTNSKKIKFTAIRRLLNAINPERKVEKL